MSSATAAATGVRPSARAREEAKEAEQQKDEEDATIAVLFLHSSQQPRRSQASSSQRRRARPISPTPSAVESDADARWRWLSSVPGPIRRLAWRERTVLCDGRGGRGGGAGGGGGGGRGWRAGLTGVGGPAGAVREAAAVWPASTAAVDLTGDERRDEWERMAASVAAWSCCSASHLSLPSLLLLDASSAPERVEQLLLRLDSLTAMQPQPTIQPAVEAALALLHSLAPSVEAENLHPPPPFPAPARAAPRPLLPPLHSPPPSVAVPLPCSVLGSTHYLHAQLSDAHVSISASIDAHLVTPAAAAARGPQSPHSPPSSSELSPPLLQVGCFVHLRWPRVVQSAYRQPHLLIQPHHVLAAHQPPPPPAVLLSGSPPRDLPSPALDATRMRAPPALPPPAAAPAVSTAVSIDWSSTEEAVLQALEAAME